MKTQFSIWFRRTGVSGAEPRYGRQDMKCMEDTVFQIRIGQDETLNTVSEFEKSSAGAGKRKFDRLSVKRNDMAVTVLNGRQGANCQPKERVVVGGERWDDEPNVQKGKWSASECSFIVAAENTDRKYRRISRGGYPAAAVV